MKFLSNLDLNKNQILNVTIQNLAAAPSSPVQGQIYFNTTDKLLYFYDNSAWKALNGDITSVVAGNGLTGGGTSGDVTLDVNVDNATIEIVGDVVRIKDLGVTTGKINDLAVTTGKIADLNVTTAKINDLAVTTAKIADSNVTNAKLATDSVTTIKITDKNVTFAKIQDLATMTVIGRVAAGTGVASGISIINDNTMATASSSNLATAGSIKSYVDSTVAALGNLEGSFDASTSTNFPTGSGGTKKGDYWYVTAAGTVQGVALNIGDVLIANKDNASGTLSSDWIFLESNRDQATTTTLGVVQLATSTEVNTGTDANKVVTPSTLSARTSTETRTGLIQLATSTEVNTGSDAVKAVTPATLSARTATETRTGIAEIATSAEITAFTDDTRIVTPLKLKDASYAYGTILATSATSYTITHNLNSFYVMVQTFDQTGNVVFCDVNTTTSNTVVLNFATAPAANEIRVLVQRINFV